MLRRSWRSRRWAREQRPLLALAEVASNDSEVEIRELAKGSLSVLRDPIVHPDGQVIVHRTDR